jgi:alkanesulfonate monooxygenase SsuD/methylene tetrahydromethanopterin reductase-like flavin-dependent oxidoreductase (luciferase family)
MAGLSRGDACSAGRVYDSAMQPWFGLHLPSHTHRDVAPTELFERVVDQARAAEAAGFTLVSVMDHHYQIRGVGELLRIVGGSVPAPA